LAKGKVIVKGIVKNDPEGSLGIKIGYHNNWPAWSWW